jgi:hypothetical protein
MWMKPSAVEVEPEDVRPVDPYVARLEEELKKQK